MGTKTEKDRNGARKLPKGLSYLLAAISRKMNSKGRNTHYSYREIGEEDHYAGKLSPFLSGMCAYIESMRTLSRRSETLSKNSISEESKAYYAILHCKYGKKADVYNKLVECLVRDEFGLWDKFEVNIRRNGEELVAVWTDSPAGGSYYDLIKN